MNQPAPASPPPGSASAEDIVRASNLRKTIIRKILQIFRAYPDLKDEGLVLRAESDTRNLFEQLQKMPPSPEQAPPIKPRSKRRGREDRKEHVGRFFLTLIEKPLRQEGVPEALIPVFAKSVQSLLGDESYEKHTQKIARLLQFATEKGYNYEQVLLSKPGKEIMQSLTDQYRLEFSGSPGFSDQLNNRLDEALVQSHKADDSEEALDIEQTVKKAYDTFTKLLQIAVPPSKK
ncbi:MAG: hypothetical protein HY580_06380 [Nitrospinae bacterium]|nr:hypothetical protein [Nitrospinota bacterium]